MEYIMYVTYSVCGTQKMQLTADATDDGWIISLLQRLRVEHLVEHLVELLFDRMQRESENIVGKNIQ